MKYKKKATSPQNFCVILSWHFFTKEELMNRKFTGKKGSEIFHSVQIDTIFKYYHLLYAEGKKF